MNALLRPCLLVGLSMLAGCSLPEVETSLEGPSFSLTAEEPVAAFEVTLCLEGPDTRDVYVSANLLAEASTTGVAATLLLDSQADRPANGAQTKELSDESTELFLILAAQGPWDDNGRRCSEPEVVEFSADGLAEGETVSVDAWTVSMLVEYQTRVFGDGPDEGDLSIEIERL